MLIEWAIFNEEELVNSVKRGEEFWRIQRGIQLVFWRNMSS
jgi:hypothetical protein